MKKLMMVLAGVLLMTGFAMAQHSAAGNVTVNVYRDISVAFDETSPVLAGSPYWMIQGSSLDLTYFQWTVTGEATFHFDFAVSYAVTGSGSVSVTAGTGPTAQEVAWNPPPAMWTVWQPATGATYVLIPGAAIGSPGTVAVAGRCMVVASPSSSGANTVTATCAVTNYTWL